MPPNARVLLICACAFFTSLLISLSVQQSTKRLILPRLSPLAPQLLREHDDPQVVLEDYPAQESQPDADAEGAGDSVPEKEEEEEDEWKESGPRYAFATFISSTDDVERAYSAALSIDQNHTRADLAAFYASKARNEGHEDPDLDIFNDKDGEGSSYFTSTRVLLYSLLHSPYTASHANDTIPVLVLHTPAVPDWQVERLKKDGGIMIRTEPLSAKWMADGLGSARWASVLAKLRLWDLEGYDAICFIDADTLVVKPLQEIFSDAGATTLETRKKSPDDRDGMDLVIERNKEVEPTIGPNGQEIEHDSEHGDIKSDYITLPKDYLFASKPEAWGFEHEIPPPAYTIRPENPLIPIKDEEKPKARPDPNYLNSGFFVMTPSHLLFEYYHTLLKKPNRDLFSPQMPEQNLLNYVHRPQGRMPWTRLDWRWNMNWPTMKDANAGVRTLHGKLWDENSGEDKELCKMWRAVKDEMIGFWRGVEAVESEGLHKGSTGESLGS